MAIATGAIVFGIVSYLHLATDIPSVEALKTFAPPTVTQFYSDDGELIEEFFIEKREVIPLSRMPDHLIQAFVAGEDARFFQHKGLDYVAILRALFRNIFSGEIVQGGSTITQQVVKSLLLTPEKSYARKFREAILAYRIEKYLSKEEILFLYLNQIYLGHGAYGVATAAETYFGKPVEELTLAESALLARLTQAE
jgi:penicillin-binding protein 1A